MGGPDGKERALTFLRIIFLYVLYFVICLIVVSAAFQNGSNGVQVLLVLFVPAGLVWWGERRRAVKYSDGGKAVWGEGSKAVSNDEARGGGPGFQERSRRAASAPKWYPKHESVTVAGRVIGGMVYVGTPPRRNSYSFEDRSRPVIDPALPVARGGNDRTGEGMPYWPGYSDISPTCRATYLTWLEGGRSDPTYNPGYMFLYFYGLERRFLQDEPPQAEKEEILEEVRRLKDLYADSRSAQRYLGDFIQVAELGLNVPAAREPVFDNPGWELPLSLKTVLGAQIARGDALSAEWVLSWFLCHPERNLRKAATRCPEEFRTLFKIRFDEKFPDGLKVRKPKKDLTESYRAASGEFNVQLTPQADGQPVPDISGLRKPVDTAQKIADDAMDQLDKYSRYLGRNPEGRGSLEAQALLPPELWPHFPSAEREALKSWAGERVDEGGIVRVTDLIARLDGEIPEKIGKRQLTGVADALARIGYGMAPDPRFALRAPKKDEPVVLFELGESIDRLEDVSPDYRAALIELALGTFIAHADGQVAEGERQALQARIDGIDGMTALERKRLRANLDWLMAVPPDMAFLRRKLKDTDAEQKTVLRAAVISIAHADSVIQSEEVAGIEKIYKALGLDPNAAYSDLHAAGFEDGPVRVKAGEAAAPGEAIPEEATAGKSALDAERIAAIRTDTARVSSVLGDIFSADEKEDEDASAETAGDAFLAGLDTKHGALLRALVTAEHWSEKEFADMAAKQGLMASGALETLNEWAFEKYDEAVLEEYDGYDVEPDIAAAVRAEFEKEAH